MAGIYRFINTNIPTVGCNLRCEYCYIKQRGNENTMLKIDNSKQLFRYSVEHMIKALTVKRLGGVCMFNISGSGETLLCPEIVEITEGLLKNGHYVALINNCTIRSRIEQLAKLPPDYRARIFFKVSFHYRELKRKNMLESFANNVHLLKNSGIGYSIEIVSNDYVLEELEELKEFSISYFGALPHVLTGRDEQIVGTYPRIQTRLSPEEYNSVWSSFDSDLFSYQQKAYDLPHSEFCYAGVYTGTLLLETGDFHPCPGTKKVTNFFEDIDNHIEFVPMAHSCPFHHCFCGFFLHVLAGVSREYDPDVYFYQFRDRLCPDNSTWLTPTIREAFSHRCSEYHQPYSTDKAYYIDLLMRKIYKGINPSPEEETELVRIVEKYLTQKGYRKIAIYGMGLIGEWLIKLLQVANIDVVCGIDRRWAEIKSNIAIQAPEDVIPSADAVIVSVYAEFTNIAPLLRKKNIMPIISITEVVF
ncbi:MAG: radical SAM protein [Fibromonadaceae bacterium]|jgi:MoaA/NifB/PqqE/SkfB family radical SAM enzyme|nr:radical SAM protein [Fibromonadaceae bacterium]